jgi:hypothetical protein
MKKYGLILLVLNLLMACDSLTRSELAGKWQLKTVEKNGVETAVDTVWYNFQSKSIFALQVYVPQQDNIYTLIGLRKQQDDIVSIKLESTANLAYSDWSGINRSFTIDHLDKKRLTLRSEEGFLYSFIKF